MTMTTERSSTPRTPRKATIELPYPPSVNGYWVQRIVIPKNGKRPFINVAVGAKGKEYRESVQATVKPPGKLIVLIEEIVSPQGELF